MTPGYDTQGPRSLASSRSPNSELFLGDFAVSSDRGLVEKFRRTTDACSIEIRQPWQMQPMSKSPEQVPRCGAHDVNPVT